MTLDNVHASNTSFSTPFVHSANNLSAVSSRVRPTAKVNCPVTLSSQLRFYYQNCRGLRTKLKEFYINALNEDYDILALTETWLHTGILDRELLTDKYIVHRRDRDSDLTGMNLGGGVLLAVDSSKFQSERVASPFSGMYFEDVWVKLNTSMSNSLLICVVYFRPNTTEDIYTEFFSKMESIVEINKTSNICIFADLNLPELTSFLADDSSSISNLSNLEIKVLGDINFFGLSQKNLIRNENDRILDVVLTNLNFLTVSKLDNYIVVPDKHHPCLEVICDFYKDKKNNSDIGDHKYNYSKGDYLKLYSLLKIQNWSILNDINDVDQCLESFYSIFYSVMDECIPKSIRRKRTYPVWFTKDIVDNLKTKERLRRKFKKSGLSADYDLFSLSRKQSKRKIELALLDYQGQVEKSIGEDPKFFWNFIKSKKQANTSQVLDYNGEKLIDDESKCQAFAEHFHSVYHPEKPNIDFDAIFAMEQSDRSNLFNFCTIDESDVQKAIKNMPGKRSFGLDGIPPYIFKGFNELISGPLTLIFNLSLKNSKIPLQFKVSAVSPVPKSNPVLSISDHRPVCILTVPAKLFDYLLYQQLFPHISPYLSETQFGFRPGRSTTSNLLILNQDICDTFNAKSQIDVIYTDFKKAFDLVMYYFLLCKLYCDFSLSRSAIEFLAFYLTGRSQYVTYNGRKSLTYNVNSGIQQGSNTGPLFFLTMINNLPEHLNYSHCLLFVDDFKLYKEINSSEDSMCLQKDLDALAEWCLANGLSLNIPKCHVVSYTLKKDPFMFSYRIRDDIISRKTVVRDLGVYFDCKLNFDHHITLKCNEAMKMLGFLKRTCYFFKDKIAIMTLYNSYVRSKLEYASLVWEPFYENQKLQIERVQKKFLRYFIWKSYHLPTYFENYYSLLITAGMLSLEDRRILQRIMYLKKLISGREDNTCLLEKLPFFCPQRNLRMRLHTFYLPGVRTNREKASPIYKVCEAGNTLINFDCDIFACSLSVIKREFTEYTQKVYGIALDIANATV